jgi:hypothetical protein
MVETDSQSKQDENSFWRSAERILDYSGLFLVFLLLAVSIAAPLMLRFFPDRQEQEIIAHWAPDPDTTILAVRGRVLNLGEPVADALVWAVLRDTRGNGASSTTDTTDNAGEFAVTATRRAFAGDSVIAAVVYARPLDQARPISRAVLVVAGEAQLSEVKISFWSIAYIPGIFLASILLAFVDFKKHLQWKHYACLTLALAFSVAMITAISLGISYVNSVGQRDQVLSLGFGSLFHDTYVTGHEKDWIFSLTSPTIRSDIGAAANPDSSGAAAEPAPPRGFGAPLWVLLLGVIGASLSTVQIVVKEITQRPEYEKYEDNELSQNKLRADVRKHIQDIVLHQFYILFAPLGAIFVYQALVIGDAADSALTVATAALGAGISFNILLQKASGAREERRKTDRQTVQGTAPAVKPSAGSTPLATEGQGTE